MRLFSFHPRSVSRKQLIGAAVVVLTTCVAVSCGTTADSPTAPELKVRASQEDCWPPSSTCEHRELTNEEWLQAKNAIDTHMNPLGGSNCMPIFMQMMDDLGSGTADTRFRFWTNPPHNPPIYWFGDRHNVPNITHLTGVAFQGKQELS